jgi:hypothetical protein
VTSASGPLCAEQAGPLYFNEHTLISEEEEESQDEKILFTSIGYLRSGVGCRNSARAGAIRWIGWRLRLRVRIRIWLRLRVWRNGRGNGFRRNWNRHRYWNWNWNRHRYWNWNRHWHRYRNRNEHWKHRGSDLHYTADRH